MKYYLIGLLCASGWLWTVYEFNVHKLTHLQFGVLTVANCILSIICLIYFAYGKNKKMPR